MTNIPTVDCTNTAPPKLLKTHSTPFDYFEPQAGVCVPKNREKVVGDYS